VSGLSINSSLLVALNTLACARTLIFLIIIVSLLATGGVQVSGLLVVVNEFDGLLGSHVDVSWLLVFQCSRNRGESLHGHLFGELDLKDNVQVTEVVSLLVERKTLLLNSLDFLGLDHLTGLVLDSNLGAVEMFENEVDAGQSLEQGNGLLHKQISSLALEQLMGLLLHNNDNITSLSAGVLISLTVEMVSLAVGCTFVDISIDDLLLLLDFLAIAILALVLLVDDFALSTAIVTRLSRLGVVAWSKLLHLSDHAATLTAFTLCDSTVFTALTITLVADALAINSNLGFLAVVYVFERDL